MIFRSILFLLLISTSHASELNMTIYILDVIENATITVPACVGNVTVFGMQSVNISVSPQVELGQGALSVSPPVFGLPDSYPLHISV